MRAVVIDSVVERKTPGLPRFVVVPSAALERWQLTGTTVVQARPNDVDLGRRSLKHWGARDCWFIDLTAKQCLAAEVDTGDRVRLQLRLASTEPPDELSALIASDPGARSVWEGFSPARRRQLSEHVRSARRTETRLRRARLGLLGR